MEETSVLGYVWSANHASEILRVIVNGKIGKTGLHVRRKSVGNLVNSDEKETKGRLSYKYNTVASSVKIKKKNFG